MVWLVLATAWAGNVCGAYRSTEFGLPCQPTPTPTQVVESAETYLLGEERPLGGIDTLCTRPGGVVSWKEDPVLRIVPKYVALRQAQKQQAELDAFFKKLDKHSKFRGAFVRALAEKDAAKRLEGLDKALKHSDDNVGALGARAQALADLGKHDDALTAYQTAIDAHLAQREAALKRHENTNEWTRVLDARVADVRRARGELLYTLERWEAAADAFAEVPLYGSAFESDSHRQSLHAIYATARAGRADKASEMATQYGANSGEPALAELGKAFALAAANDGAKTVVALTRMAKLLQDYPYTVNNIEVDLEKDPLFDKVRAEKGFAEVVRAVAALRK